MGPVGVGREDQHPAREQRVDRLVARQTDRVGERRPRRACALEQPEVVERLEQRTTRWRTEFPGEPIEAEHERHVGDIWERAQLLLALSGLTAGPIGLARPRRQNRSGGDDRNHGPHHAEHRRTDSRPLRET